MHDRPSRSRVGADSPLERAVLLALLCSEETDGWTLGELAADLEAALVDVERVLRLLHEDGLVDLHGRRASASRAARRVDELVLLAI